MMVNDPLSLVSPSMRHRQMKDMTTHKGSFHPRGFNIIDGPPIAKMAQI
jgi:hypothetical protein